MDAKAEKMTLFRYGHAPLVLETLPRRELMQRAQEIAARHYEIPGSQRIAVSVDSLLHWARRYRQGGFEALAPQPRQDRGTFRAITPHLAEWIERLKRENPTDHHLSQHLEELPPSSFAPGSLVAGPFCFAKVDRFLCQHPRLPCNL